MEISGKVIQVLPVQSFKDKQGGDVNRYGFVIDTGGRYPHRVKFDVTGVERWSKLSSSVVVGADVQVSFDVSSREWQGKWFTSCDAWRVFAVGAQSYQPQSSQPAPVAAPVQAPVSQPQPAPEVQKPRTDLPF